MILKNSQENSFGFVFSLKSLSNCLLAITLHKKYKILNLDNISSFCITLQWPDWAVKGFITQYQSYKFNFDEIPIISDNELSRLPAKTLILMGQDEVLYDPRAVQSRIRSVAPSITVDILPRANTLFLRINLD